MLVALAALLLIIDAIAVWLVVIGAPYVPSRPEGIEKILACAELQPGMKAADIGSGDGRIVIAMARRGVEAHGYEINPVLVWWSNRKIRRANLERLATVHWKNLWHVDFSPYDAVTLFGVSHIMRRLEVKLRRELKPGARAVSIAFEFPSWPVAKRIDGVTMYEN